MTSPILEVKNLQKHYEVKTGFRKKQTIKALQDVSFSVQPRTTLGIVGETGSGKSTLIKTIMQIVQPTRGDIHIHGQSYKQIPKLEYLKKIQMIFQDPYRSLNPRKKIVDIICNYKYESREKLSMEDFIN